jgi:hypothetical protein
MRWSRGRLLRILLHVPQRRSLRHQADLSLPKCDPAIQGEPVRENTGGHTTLCRQEWRCRRTPGEKILCKHNFGAAVAMGQADFEYVNHIHTVVDSQIMVKPIGINSHRFRSHQRSVMLLGPKRPLERCIDRSWRRRRGRCRLVAEKESKADRFRHRTCR